ncbi:MAG: serine hydrolase [Armatimonadota bacterium]
MTSLTRRICSMLAALVWGAALCVVCRAAEPADLADVPFVGGVAMDGSAEDWGAAGFQVNLLRTTWGKADPDDGFDARYRLGWNDRGLLIYYSVRDADISEPTEQPKASQGDGVQIEAAPADRPSAWFKIFVSPGISPKHDRPVAFADNPLRPKDVAAAAAIEASSRTTEGGYELEVLVPWRVLDMTPAVGAGISFQTYALNTDKSKQTSGLGWTPVLDTWGQPRLRLSREPSEAINAYAASIEPRGFTRIAVRVRTVPELVGKSIVLRDGGAMVASGRVEPDGKGLGRADLTMPARLTPPGYGRLDIAVADTAVGRVAAPTGVNLLCPQGLEAANLRFEPYVFAGPDFPRCEFERPELAELLLGPYAITATYYDKDYNVVTKAEAAGRYGAIIEVKPERGGKAIRRYRTLYRQPEPYEWWFAPLDFTLKLPKEFGIDPRVADAEMPDLSETIKWSFFGDLLSSDRRLPALFAGWSEMKPTGAKAPKWADGSTLDRQWWLGLKRKSWGLPPASESRFVSPRPIEGKPATVLHEGTLAEAGMKPDAAESIDRVLQAWAADSDEGFAALVARHGVIVLHKAYGRRDGQPMTTETKSWMASITKTLSSNLMWMLVDQGLVDLDATVDTYLPPLRGIEVARPLTVRHLYTHTSGFPLMDHWGDEMSDLEEVVADYYPYLAVGAKQAYNGVGLAIGGKIIESFTGEAIPMCFQKHLLGPLGCANTDVAGTMGDARSVPLDIAKIGQLMLNRGAYGDMRFYREETFEKMLPQPLTKVLGRDDGSKCGIGLWNWDYPGLSSSTFGHGAASSADLIVDPVNDLIIVMTRNSAGKNFEGYHRQFIQAVVDAMEKEPPR